jgi:hypothetical protein
VGKTNIDPLLGPRNIPFAESLGKRAKGDFLEGDSEKVVLNALQIFHSKS